MHVLYIYFDLHALMSKYTVSVIQKVFFNLCSLIYIPIYVNKYILVQYLKKGVIYMYMYMK